jgi:two-component system, NarL family, nitrate/nitrite response regulator NarL
MSRPNLAGGTVGAEDLVDHARIGAPVNDSPRVLIADDHVPTRARVSMVLERGGFEICAHAGNARAAIDAAVRELPDVCLLDVHMPGSGITAAEEINARLAGTVVVMLTVSHEANDLSDARRAGARGYLLKDMDPALMSEALRSALRGDAVFPDLP